MGRLVSSIATASLSQLRRDHETGQLEHKITYVSMPDLRYRGLAEIRKQPGCSTVQGIAISRLGSAR
jgi:hypothetical protein